MGEEEGVDLKAEEAEMMQRLQEEIQNLTVSDHLFYMVESLSALAISRMGLTAETAERRDLDQARLAIDAFKALLEVMERTRPSEAIAVQRSSLSQLQLAYVAALDAGATTAAADDRPDGAAR
jgi:hypothetical protein